MSTTHSTVDVTSDMERVSPAQMLVEIIEYEVLSFSILEMQDMVIEAARKRVMQRHWSDAKLAEEYYKMIGGEAQ